MPVVWSDRHRLHDPGGEVWVGVRTPGTELPERAERIRTALEERGAHVVDAEPQPDEAVTSVHDPELAGHLADAWSAWGEAGLTEDPGQDRVVPYLFPHPDLFSGLPPPRGCDHRPRGPVRLRHHDPYRPGDMGGGARGTRHGGHRGGLVLDGAPAAYACTRPPGHHATRSAFGGSCYLNNSAAAAARLRAAGIAPVAVIDIDAHHGNGTQAIFWDDDDVMTGSVHVDPAPAGSRISSASRTSAARADRTATWWSRPAAATSAGSRQ